MKNKELTLKEIHQETLVIIKKIVDICDELNIDYFLAYGTLLGAVRHKGFIPWDDDFDILMLRSDYDKFLLYCKEHEQELKPFKLMNYYNTERYTFAISRFCDLRYEMIMDDGNDVGMGMFIDVYPFDGLGMDVSKCRNKYLDIRNKLVALGVYYSDENNTIPNSGNILKQVMRKVFIKFVRVLGKPFFISCIERAANRHTIEESKYIDCVIWDDVIPVNKEYFNGFAYLEFEGMNLKVPKNYHEVLKTWYGDYMQLPPEDERVPHHEYKLYKKC